MKRCLLVLGTGLTLGACDKGDTKLQYMPDMADAPTVKAQEDFLDPPDGSIPMFSILYPNTPQEAETILKNPLGQKPTEKVIDEGRALYNTYCKVCHGSDGKGVGTLGESFPQAPDFTIAPYTTYGDGFFFHKITFGSAVKQGDKWVQAGLMPGYGDKTEPQERWQIVAYLRTLQGK